jgi:hypothetical protein
MLQQKIVCFNSRDTPTIATRPKIELNIFQFKLYKRFVSNIRVPPTINFPKVANFRKQICKSKTCTNRRLKDPEFQTTTRHFPQPLGVPRQAIKLIDAYLAGFGVTFLNICNNFPNLNKLFQLSKSFQSTKLI